jgi:hypothetical protein
MEGPATPHQASSGLEAELALAEAAAGHPAILHLLLRGLLTCIQRSYSRVRRSHPGSKTPSQDARGLPQVK